MRADRLAATIRSHLLRQAHAAWQAARGPGLLPSPAGMASAGLPGAEHSSVVAVERAGAEPVFRIRRAGAALIARAGRAMVGEVLGATPRTTAEDPLGSAAWAYRRSMDTRLPTYEYGHFSLGDGAPFLFERLLLPLGHAGRVDTIIALTLFSDTGFSDTGG